MTSQGAHRRWCYTCPDLPRSASASDTLGKLPVLHRMAMSSIESVLRREMVGRLMEVASERGWWSILGSATTRNHSSLKAAWIWFVNAPGTKWPASGMAPIAVKCHWLVFLEMMLMSVVLSMATKGLLAAASSRSSPGS